MDGSASILLEDHKVSAGRSVLGLVSHGCTTRVTAAAAEGLGEGTVREVRGLARESRTSAVCEVTGDTGPFSWFSSLRKVRVMDFFQCFGVEDGEEAALVSMTRDRGSCCSWQGKKVGEDGDGAEHTDRGDSAEKQLLPGEMVDTSSESAIGKETVRYMVFIW